MVTPAEDPRVHGRGPGRMSLSDSSGTEGERSDSYQVFPDYSQLVPDRTGTNGSGQPAKSSQLPVVPISYIMSTKLHLITLKPNGFHLPGQSKECHHRPLHLDDLFRSEPADSDVNVRPSDGGELIDHHVAVVVQSR